MDRWVEVSFDCLPLRSVGRMDIPLDASPKYQQRCERIKSAMQRHGSYNSYFLYNAKAIFHLTNDPQKGMMEYSFEGTVLTDTADESTKSVDLNVQLLGETCDWLIQPVVDWFEQTVREAVKVEFDRFIRAGDLEKTRQRLKEIEAASDGADGFLGMYL
ncbi:MAG: hypothetical protein CMJ79_06705 [Planctomycetaceae bacterium]|jgi:hypothetical protein|nr:hypothetical protein [Planctomycetaceae bacterium]|tara:strand:- start:2307 stop:2783 length:477 start_codon:yes stop_codon:yes gene_type:complete